MGVTMVMETLMDTMGKKMVQGVAMGIMEIMQMIKIIMFPHKMALGP
jgi:hypothetical protein